jgi:hypothetical protein
MLRTGRLLDAQGAFVVTLRRSGLPFRRPPATGLLGHYPDRTLTGKPTATSSGHTPLLFRTRPCVRAAPHTPRRPTADDWTTNTVDMAFTFTVT